MLILFVLISLGQIALAGLTAMIVLNLNFSVAQFQPSAAALQLPLAPGP